MIDVTTLGTILATSGATWYILYTQGMAIRGLQDNLRLCVKKKVLGD